MKATVSDYRERAHCFRDASRVFLAVPRFQIIRQVHPGDVDNGKKPALIHILVEQIAFQGRGDLQNLFDIVGGLDEPDVVVDVLGKVLFFVV